MTTYATLNAQLTEALQADKDLVQLKQTWQQKVDKISAFMEMFLEKCGNRLIGDKTNSPEWKLYESKTQEYNDYTRAIRNADYFIAKNKFK